MLQTANKFLFMIQVLNITLFIGIIFFLIIPSVVLLIECIASLFSQSDHSKKTNLAHPRTVVLVPAHNEAEQIESVLQKVLAQLNTQDRLVVIADNCHDETAALARSTGATVIERFNQEKRGKGYALDYGLKFIENDPPEVVVILDADCQIEPGTISSITRLAQDSGRPVQATYLMDQPDHPSLKDKISMFSLTVKNLVRLKGLNSLGWHSLLTGSGMAFPWSVISKVSLAGSKTTDDMQLTVDLAIAGDSPIFSQEALVTGRLMKNKHAQSQRMRWEHGHIEMILVEVPRLLKEFIKQRRIELLILALDIFVPPLSLLVMIWLIATFICSLAVTIGASLLPVAVALVAGCLIVAAVLLAWWQYGRNNLSLLSLIAIPFYVLSKIPIYLKFLVQPQSRWLRTERDG
ncbi:glycosyl transferase family 2 [Stanieria cyanosphaera PCC 7437]|uniref:Glycosyl transferase family 2 n=2 Tax=Stanieria cyanosphaera TaxID=102116 RepID=K9XQC6_STAC7|nr:glycosyl transferase family 2 [Stanieria cyanosphaera PCC 7437]